MNSTERLMAIAVAAALSGAAVAQTGTSPAAGERGIASPIITAPAGPGGTTAPGVAAGAPDAATRGAAATYQLKAARLSKLDGLNIYDSNAKKIGEVLDLVFDPATGRVVHALVSVGGVLGVGDKEYEVPTNQLRVFSRAVDDTVPLKAELGVAPDSLTAARKLDKESPYVPGSRLIDMDVNDSSGKEVGEVEDLVVDLQSGEVRHALIEFEDSWSVEDRLFAFPMTALKRDKDGKTFTLSVNKESLGGTPSIEKARFDKVDLADPSWLQAGRAGKTGGTPAAAGETGVTGATGAPGAAGSPR